MESSGNGKEVYTCNKGNYKGYYKMRTDSNNRLQYLSESWFRGKACLDVGCNDGQFCIALAETFGPDFILGIDPDFVLIDSAQSRVKRLVYAHNQANTDNIVATATPTSAVTKLKSTPVVAFRSGFLPRALAVKAPAKPATAVKVTAPTSTNTDHNAPSTSSFPHNIVFKARDFFDLSCTLSSSKESKYDIVTLFSVTKWVHLTGGDNRLLELFCRLYSLVRSGGRVVIEYQPWKSYENNKNTSEVTKSIFPTIRIRPDLFEWVLTFIVGFEIEARLGVHLDHAKGFDRPILVLRRPVVSSSTTGVSNSGVSDSNGESSTSNNNTNSSNSKNKSKNNKPSAVGNATDGFRDGKKLWENVASFDALSSIVYKRIQRGTAVSISGTSSGSGSNSTSNSGGNSGGNSGASGGGSADVVINSDSVDSEGVVASLKRAAEGVDVESEGPTNEKKAKKSKKSL